MKEAAQDLRKRKENKPESVVYSSWKEIGKSLTGALADLTLVRESWFRRYR